MCGTSNVDGGLAFAIFTEFLLFPLILASVFFVIGKFPRSAYAWLLFISGPVLLLFGIITLAALNDCTSEVGNDLYGNRGSFALTTGIRALLLGLFLTALIFVNKFLFKGNWTYKETGEYTKPAARPDSDNNYNHHESPSGTSTQNTTHSHPYPPQQSATPGGTNTMATPMPTTNIPPQQHQAVPMYQATAGAPMMQNPAPAPPQQTQ